MNKSKNMLLLLTIAIATQNTEPTKHKHNEGFDQMIKAGAKLKYNPENISQLKKIFANDNDADLQRFVIANPNFNWNLAYTNLPWSGNPATPLNAAAWFGSKKCVWYLLLEQPGNFMKSINTKSGSGHTSLAYASHPPKKRTFPYQKNENFKAIAASLKSVGAKK
ncbi:MAG: hypothetical protein NTU89_00220 [Candidatus Dependentiae bacterium]|nr:hypothetical protein [Candidatus Dependentiae bacterium]